MQLFPVLAVNIAAISSGLAIGFSAILLPQLRPTYNQTDHYTSEVYQPFLITEEEGSWIAAMFSLGAIFGGLISAYLGKKFGRRVFQYISAVIIAYIFIHLVGSLIFIPLIKKTSRKLLLSISSVMMGTALAGLAIWMSYSSAATDWVPVICLLVYMLAAPLGLCSLPFLLQQPTIHHVHCSALLPTPLLLQQP